MHCIGSARCSTAARMGCLGEAAAHRGSGHKRGVTAGVAQGEPESQPASPNSYVEWAPLSFKQ